MSASELVTLLVNGAGDRGSIDSFTSVVLCDAKGRKKFKGCDSEESVRRETIFRVMED